MVVRRISEADVTEAERHVRVVGAKRYIAALEVAQPHVAAFLMESATQLYGRLDRACPSYGKVRSLHSLAVRIALVCIEVCSNQRDRRHARRR